MNKLLKLGVPILLIGVLIPLGYFGYSEFNKKEVVLKDTLPAHHHIRLNLTIEGENIDFGDAKYQEIYEPGACSALLTKTPIHFHDDVNHLVHIHWDKITGGQVLKYYGINLIGGDDNVLVYQPSEDIKKSEVPIHGKILPQPKESSKYWIYKGVENDYTQENIDDFATQDLETFFDKKSTLTIQREEASKTSFNIFKSIKALAHGEGKEGDGEDHSQEELKELQNLLGDIVVFAQENEPSVDEINAKFRNLTPLTPSVCGG